VAPSSGLVRDSPVPLHSQLRHVLVGMIEDGRVQPGEALPPERTIADSFGVSLAPVRQAILDLVAEGLLYRVRGKGTFLREPALVENVSILSSFSASMRRRGLDVEMHLLRRASTGGLMHLERLGLVGGEPLALFESRLSTRRFPGLGDAVERRGSLFDALELDYGVVAVRADTVVEVGRCTSHGWGSSAVSRSRCSSPACRGGASPGSATRSSDAVRCSTRSSWTTASSPSTPT